MIFRKEPVVAGPKRPQDKVKLSEVHINSAKEISKSSTKDENFDKRKVNNGDIVLAAITSCTNTANPYLMVAAGLLAKNACKFGLKKKLDKNFFSSGKSSCYRLLN